MLVVEAAADIWKEGLISWGESGSGGRGEGVGVPRGEVRLVLRQCRRPVVVGKVMPSSSTTSSSSVACGLVGVQMVACRRRNVSTWLVLTPQVKRRHRLVVRGSGVDGGGCCVIWRRSHVRVRVIIEAHLDKSVLPVDLQVLSQRRRVSVGLVASSHSASERLLCRVDVHVLLSVARVGETSIAALNLALERLLT